MFIDIGAESLRILGMVTSGRNIDRIAHSADTVSTESACVKCFVFLYKNGKLVCERMKCSNRASLYSCKYRRNSETYFSFILELRRRNEAPTENEVFFLL